MQNSLIGTPEDNYNCWGSAADARGISMAQAGKSTFSQVRALGVSGAGYMKWANRIGKGANVLGALATIGDAAVKNAVKQ